MPDDPRHPPDDRRRSARLPLRLRVQADAAGHSVPGHTEDVSAQGCSLVAPRPLARGDRVRLLIAPGEHHGPLQVSGVVAWISRGAPWTHGVAFAATSAEVAARWLVRLVSHRGRARDGRSSDVRADPTITPIPLPLAVPPTARAAPGPRPVGRVSLVTRRARRRPPG